MRDRNRALEIIQNRIEQAQAKTTSVIEKISSEVPRDKIVSGRNIRFVTEGNRIYAMTHDTESMHRHAIDQALQRGPVAVPKKFADDLLEKETGPWGAELLTVNLNNIYRNSPNNFLMRSVKNEVRGFLSDRYRRLNTAPIVEAMIEKSQTSGAVLYDAVALETKWRLKLLLPDVFEPVPGEIVAYGMSFGNSDYGDGALSMSSFILRVWCMNGATMEDVFRQIHLGRRLDENIAYSQETYRLDTQATVSAVRDITSQVLDVRSVEETMSRITKAAETEVDATAAIRSLQKKGTITQGEAKDISEAYNSADIVLMPAGNNAWRLSNAVSLIAGNKMTQGENRRGIELQSVAGQLLAA